VTSKIHRQVILVTDQFALLTVLTKGNQQATLTGRVPGRGVLRDYEQRGCDAEDIVQPPQECGIGR